MISKPLSIQIRVIKALFLREMISHFGRKNIGFIWMFMEPMMFTVGITILWSFSEHKYGSMSPAGFALTGYSTIVAWRNCIGRTSGAIRANHGLLYHRNVTILDLALTRAIFEFTAVTVSFTFLTLVFYALGLSSLPQNPLKVLIAWLLLGFFFVGAGLIALYLSEKSELFQRIWHVVLYLALPFTGALTMVSWIPNKSIQSLLLFSPMVNGVELLREGMFGKSINAMYSIQYLVFFDLITLLIGFSLVKKVKKVIQFE